jgi:hypothetical protein
VEDSSTVSCYIVKDYMQINAIIYPSSICPFSKKESEDEYHFVVGCHLKWEAWRKEVDIVQYPSLYTDTMNIWQTILLQKLLKDDASKRHSIDSLSTVWAAIWKVHWRYTMEMKRWIPEAYFWAIWRNQW